MMGTGRRASAAIDKGEGRGRRCFADAKRLGRGGRWRVLLVAALLTGCGSTGPTDDPVSRSLGWFSYLNGDDLRAACRPGAPETYRMVFNGVFVEQLRSYDLAVQPDGGGTLRAWARTAADISEVELGDLLRPWRGTSATTDLDAGAVDAIRAALTESGAFAPAPRGLRLPSDSFYWIVNACRDGEFSFNAFLFPSPRFEVLTFPAALLDRDRTGVPYNVPRGPEDPPYGSRSFPPYGEEYEDSRASSRFVLQVGENGLIGLLRLF